MTDVLTRNQILENRKKAIAFLKEPQRKKAKQRLDMGDGRRCCLGHMSYALGIARQKSAGFSSKYCYGHRFEDTVAPQELIGLIGLWDDNGGKRTDLGGNLRDAVHGNLTCMNDDSNMTPQEIGEYLETVIEGGEDTPFMPLDMLPMEPEDSNLR